MKFYLVNPSDLAKTEKTHGSETQEQEKNPVQIPHPSKATFKFPSFRAQCKVKCPGYASGGGGGVLRFRIDRRKSKTLQNNLLHYGISVLDILQYHLDKYLSNQAETLIQGSEKNC